MGKNDTKVTLAVIHEKLENIENTQNMLLKKMDIISDRTVEQNIKITNNTNSIVRNELEIAKTNSRIDKIYVQVVGLAAIVGGGISTVSNNIHAFVGFIFGK